MRHPLFARHTPRLRFITDPETPVVPGGVPPIPAATPPATPEFPANTAVTDMTDKEQAAYWKYHSRKHEGVANSRADYDDQKAKADRLAAIEAANQSDTDRAIADAKKAGEAAGANRFLADAVLSRVMFITGKDEAALAGALDLIDVTKLTKADGALDVEKIKSLAESIGTKAPAEPDVPPVDPIRAAMERQRSNPAPTGGSIAAMKQGIIDAHSGKSTTK